MNLFKRTTGIILAAVMLLSAGAIGANASETLKQSNISETEDTISSTGVNVWTFDKKTGEIKFEKLDDILTYTPDGEDDGVIGEKLPWYSFREQIKTATFIGGMSFIDSTVCAGMKNLEKVNIPDSVKGIGFYSFYNCDNLETINIPDSVTEIKDSAFYSCDNLKSVKIPAKAEAVMPYTFEDCKSLESVELPDGLKVICEYAFLSCENLKKIDIPDSVTAVNEYAFTSCKNLKDIKISPCLNKIGVKAFGDTAFDNDAANWDNDVLYLDNYLLKAKETVSGDLKIKDGTTVVADQAFDGCGKLKSVSFPASIKTVGEDAFIDANSLKAFKISDVAAWCNVEFPFNNYIEKDLYVNDVLVKELVIPVGVSKINSCAFWGCKNITKLTIPSTVKDIENRAFMGCTGLKSVTFPEGVEYIGITSFYECKNLKSATIPKSVTKIDEDAFKKTAEGFTINGYADTAAQKYAKDNGTKFKNLKTGKVTDYGKKNPIKVKVKKTSIKAKALKKDSCSVRPFKISKAKGKVTCTIVKKGTTKKIRNKVIVKKKGTIIFTKGSYKKGTYKVKVKINAAGAGKYKSKTLTKTANIIIK